MFRLWLIRRRLTARNRQYRLGYTWAMSELHRGSDPEQYLFSKYNTGPFHFDIGARDAIYDFNNMDAEAMWAKRRELLR